MARRDLRSDPIFSEATLRYQFGVRELGEKFCSLSARSAASRVAGSPGPLASAASDCECGRAYPRKKGLGEVP